MLVKIKTMLKPARTKRVSEWLCAVKTMFKLTWCRVWTNTAAFEGRASRIEGGGGTGTCGNMVTGAGTSQNRLDHGYHHGCSLIRTDEPWTSSWLGPGCACSVLRTD